MDGVLREAAAIWNAYGGPIVLAVFAVVLAIGWRVIARRRRAVLADTVDGVPRRLPGSPWLSRRYERLSSEEKKAWWRRHRATVPWIWVAFFATAAVGFATGDIVLFVLMALIVWALVFYSVLGGRLPRDGA